MRKLILLALLFTGLVPAAVVRAESVSGVVVNGAKASNFTKDMNVGAYERFSVQVDLADSHPSTPSFAGGSAASLTLTVADYLGLHGRASSATITVMSGQNEALAGTYIEINGRRYAQGSQWAVGYTSTATAANIAAAIDAHWEYSATASSNVITVVAASIGVYANSWTKATSNAAKLAFTAWSAGQEYGYLSINGTTLTEGTAFTAETSSHVTANAIAVALNANAAIAAIVNVSSSVDGTNLGVLTLTADVNGGAEYPLSVSDAADLVPSANKLGGGKASDVNLAGDYITEVAHGLPLGLGVVYSTGSNKTIGGLTHGGTYYVIPRDADTFQLASSAANADAGTEIDLTSAEDATFTLTPQPFASAGTDGIKWLGSNDGVSFYDLSTTSVPYHADGGAVISFTDYAYQWLRLSFTKPTLGALDVNAVFTGRK